jgi:DNA-binding winged helix-turn-helix (wHTH) protein/tetratricopeptide (TPR) repeat protein
LNNRRACQVFTFGAFRLDSKERLLLNGDSIVPITPKAFDTLLVLLKSAGHIVTKDELLETVWPDTVVEESTLAQNVATIRRALSDRETNSPGAFIETVPKHGYRFVTPVETFNGDEIETILVQHESSRTLLEVDEIECDDDPERQGLPVSRLWKAAFGSRARLLAIALVLLAAFVISLRLFLSTAEVTSVAVVPLTEEDFRESYLAGGLIEEVIDRLAQLQELRVTAFSTVYQIRDHGLDLQQLGGYLGVEKVLTIRVLEDEEGIKGIVELVQASDQSHIWGKQYSWTGRQMPLAPSQIATEVSEALGVKFTPQVEREFTRQYTKNPEAYLSYLQGQFFWHQFTGGALEKGLVHFQKAVQLDPEYALAHTALADSYNVLGFLGRLRPADAFPQAKQASLKALAIDETLAEAHVSIGAYQLFYEWNWVEAERALNRAAQLKPSYAQSLELNTRYGDSRHYYCYLLDSAGRLEESIAVIKKALQIDPLSKTLQTELGFAYLFSGRYQEAIFQLKKTLELDPAFVFASAGLARVLLQEKRYQEAIRELQKAHLIVPSWPQLTGELAYAQGIAGKLNEAQETIEDLHGQAEEGFVDPFHFAVAYLGSGDEGAALMWLKKAYTLRSPLMIWLRVDPRFDRLRSHPEFVSLIRQIWR